MDFNYDYWESLSESELARMDIGEIQLRLSAGLPAAADDVQIDFLLEKLNGWTSVVEWSTKRWMSRFDNNPSKYEHSVAKFRAMCMVTVIQRDLGVKYNLPFVEGAYDATDSRNVLLHGVLSGFGGTCATLPFLYVAIGRRLGYPLFVVPTKEHLFARWDDGNGERFNFEPSGRGFEPRTDDYYRHWPREISETDERDAGFLRSYTRREELAVSLTHRGRCFQDNFLFVSAMFCFRSAAQLSPFERGPWMVATILQRMARAFDPHGLSLDLPTKRLLAHARQPVTEKWEAWAVPQAEAEFCRIIDLHREKRRREIARSRDTLFATYAQPEFTQVFG
ncbi:MAG: transglutaminase family protein [Pirellulaceae bacterium]